MKIIIPSIRRANVFFIILYCFFLLSSTSSAASIPNNSAGYRLLIYYGTPEGVNDLWDPIKAARIFTQYDYVVFGDGLEFPDETHHNSTVEVIKVMLDLKPEIKIFGYVDLGVTTDNLTLVEIKKRISQWQATGANGIFLDDAGFDYKVSRSRMNEAIRFVHKLDMPAFINAWHPAEVMDSTPHPVYNPKGEKTLINSQDYYLLEDFLQPTDITNSKQPSVFTSSFAKKMDQLLLYRKALGVKLLSISIIDYETYSSNAVRKFFRMNEATAAVFSLDGYGLAPESYSSSEISPDVVGDFPYIQNYMDYYDPKLKYVPKYNNKDFASRGFRIHSEPGKHFYNYPADVQY